jgi:hypothetical protein
MPFKKLIRVRALTSFDYVTEPDLAAMMQSSVSGRREAQEPLVYRVRK